jgi:hypothetical protein
MKDTPILSETLDCESYASSIKCLAETYAAKISDVGDFLSAFDLDLEYQKRNISVSGDEYLTGVFQVQFGNPVRVWNKINWFHLTRVPSNTNFAEGILPLRLALPKIWRAIIAVLDDTRKKAVLERLRDTGVPDFQYSLKAGDALHHGPYAMLVRESAFHSAEMGNHDYLRIPEIIEDICNGYEKQTGESILDEVANSLKPCIVKFENPECEDGEDGRHLMRALLYYCWSKCRDEELCYLANTCFDAQSKTIPRSAIQKIEFL